MTERLSTGIEFLDKQIGGGLVPGRVVCLRTEPESQGELLLREVARRHGALYLSTTRSDASVAEWLAADGEAVDVEYAGVDGLAPRGGAAVRQWVEEASGWSTAPQTAQVDGTVHTEAVTMAIDAADRSVIVDPVNPLERGDEQAYLGFLHRLQDRIRTTGSLGFVHVVDSPSTPAGRWLTLQMADEVWDISVNVKNMRVEFLLTVTKSRSDEVPNRQLKLDLGRDVDVDTSREIA